MEAPSRSEYVKDILDTITTRIEKSCHGTGDVYASACTGARVRGRLRFEAAKIAADYTVLCIENTQDDPDHWYGVKFEPVLPELIRIY